MKNCKALVSILSASAILYAADSCSAGGESAPYKSYATEEEISLRSSAVPLVPVLENSSGEYCFRLQYPSGTENGGIRLEDFNSDPDFKNKYFLKYTDINGTDYIRFSLDASDNGKTQNGSSVRVELAQNQTWALQGNHSFSYSFYGTCTDVSQTRFTVGQFLASALPDSTGGRRIDRPLCRIEIDGGEIIAYVRNYYEANQADGDTVKIHLGIWKPAKETIIKLQLEDKKLTIFRDGEEKGKHTFSDKVSTESRNYFKAGIYYQNKNSPKIFTEIFMRNLKVE